MINLSSPSTVMFNYSYTPIQLTEAVAEYIQTSFANLSSGADQPSAPKIWPAYLVWECNSIVEELVNAHKNQSTHMSLSPFLPYIM